MKRNDHARRTEQFPSADENQGNDDWFYRLLITRTDFSTGISTVDGERIGTKWINSYILYYLLQTGAFSSETNPESKYVERSISSIVGRAVIEKLKKQACTGTCSILNNVRLMLVEHAGSLKDILANVPADLPLYLNRYIDNTGM